jgi:hypothetical protein
MNPVLPQHLRAGIISISPQEPTEEPQSLEAFTMSAQQQQQHQQQNIMNIEISESQDGGQHNIILSSSSSSDYCGPRCNMPIPTTISTIRKESERPRSMLTALLNQHNDTEEESSTNLLIQKQQQQHEQQQPLKLSPRKSNSCSSLMIGEEDDSHTIPLPTKSVSPPSDIPPSMLLPQKSILSLSDGENHYHPRR